MEHNGGEHNGPLVELKNKSIQDKKINISDLPANHPLHKQVSERSNVIYCSLFMDHGKIDIRVLCDRIAKLEITTENILKNT